MAEIKQRRSPRKAATTKDAKKSSGLDGELLDKVNTALKKVNSSYSGPVPSAEMVKGYEEILPGSADRFLSMAEREQDWHHQREVAIIKNDTKRKRSSTLIFFAIAGVAVFALWAGHPVAATIIITMEGLPKLIRGFRKAQKNSSAAS